MAKENVDAHQDDQVGLEQAALDTMYAELDRRATAVERDLTEVLRVQAEDSTEQHTREARASRLRHEQGRLRQAERGLCFGRIDAADGATLHIGRLGLRVDSPAGPGEHGDPTSPLLVDWRAEAAQPFYAATSEHTFGLRRRRHLRLAGRRVESVTDDVLTGSPTAQDVVGDSALAEALSAKRTGRMREAISTLQREQDLIVRSTHRGVTVVEGGPGTGKTVVALHRAAFVLYAFPRAAEDGVLVLGPNARFLDYISEVLPSLGENDVVLETAATLLPHPVRHRDDDEATRSKGRGALAELLAERVRSRQAPGSPGFRVIVGSEPVTLPSSAVDRARGAAQRTGRPHNIARDDFRTVLVDQLVQEIEDDTARLEQRLDDEFLEATGMNLDKAAAADLRRLGLDSATVADLGGLDAEDLRDRLEDDAHVDACVEELWPRLDPEVETRALLVAEGLAGADRRGWSAADLPLLDEALALIDGGPDRTYGHVVVDEAQELSDLQWRMVMRRCPSRSMTIVGDFAQAGPVPTARSFSEALSPFVQDRFERATLTVNYRTTEQIIAATTDLLTRIAPEQEPSHSVRTGNEPRTLTPAVGDLTDVVRAEVQAHHATYAGETIGVIAAAERVDALRTLLAAEAVTVLDAEAVRGLEFDAVLILAPEEVERARESGPRDLYVALTRATKRLVLLSPGRS